CSPELREVCLAPKTNSLPAATSVVHILVALSASRPQAPRSCEPESSG
ncbi:MAG: hypothetical protein AVDCRST_MAG59-3027, partial [uncultured Thermomicrobiales bacterium]